MTKGRHFYGCARKVCDFFEWDPEEQEALKRLQDMQQQVLNKEVIPERKNVLEVEEKKELEKRLAFKEMQLRKVQMDMANLKQTTQEALTVSAQAQQEALMMQRAEYEVTVKQLQNQVLWTAAVAGEDRMYQVQQDPAFQETVNAQAMAMRRTLEAQENEL